MRNYLDKAINLVENYRKDASAINEDLRIPNENKYQLTLEKKLEYQPKLRELRNEAMSAIGARRRELSSRMEGAFQPAGNAEANIAADNQVWARIKPALDAGVSPTAILQDAESRGDKRAVRVMGDNYRWYAAATSGDMADIDHLDKAVSQSKYQLGDSEYKAYADELTEMDKVENHINVNLNAASGELDTTQPQGAVAMLRSDGSVADMSTS